MGAGTCPSRGWESTLFCRDDGDASFDELYYPQSVTVAKALQTIDMSGLRGSVEHHSDNFTTGTYEVSGQVSMYSTPADLDNWLPRILGGTGSSPWTPTGDLPAFDILHDRVASDGTGTKFLYEDCVVNRATFTGRAREPIMMTLEIMGLTRGALVTTAGTGTRASTAAYRPHLFQNLTLTFGGNTVLVNEFTLTIDNVVESDWQNSETPTSLCSTDQLVTLAVNCNWTDSVAADVFETNNGAGVLTFNTTDLTCVWTFADMRKGDTDPVVNARTKIPFDVTLQAYASGDSGSIVSSVSVANDSTP